MQSHFTHVNTVLFAQVYLTLNSPGIKLLHSDTDKSCFTKSHHQRQCHQWYLRGNYAHPWVSGICDYTHPVTPPGHAGDTDPLSGSGEGLLPGAPVLLLGTGVQARRNPSVLRAHDFHQFLTTAKRGEPGHTVAERQGPATSTGPSGTNGGCYDPKGLTVSLKGQGGCGWEKTQQRARGGLKSPRPGAEGASQFNHVARAALMHPKTP